MGVAGRRRLGAQPGRGAAADPRVRRRRRSTTPRSSTALVATSPPPGVRPGFDGLLDAVWRERGFGDFWGYALVAEGAAEAMVEVGLSRLGRGGAAACSSRRPAAAPPTSRAAGRSTAARSSRPTALLHETVRHRVIDRVGRSGCRSQIPVGAVEAPPVERAAATAAPATRGSLDDPRALQILSTEHWSLWPLGRCPTTRPSPGPAMFLSFLAASLIGTRAHR